MATWCWIFPRSIPAIVAHAAFSLLVLLAVTAPSLHNAAVGTRLQGAESATDEKNTLSSVKSVTPNAGADQVPGSGPAAGAVGTAAVGLTDEAVTSAGGNKQVVNVDNSHGGQDPKATEEGKEKAKPPGEPGSQPPQKGESNNDTDSSTTSTPTGSTPNDAPIGVAASFATLAVALCANMITTS